MVGFRTDDAELTVVKPAIGYIDITVESNVNKLYFKYALNQICLSINVETLQSRSDDTSNARIIVPVNEFTCTNKLAYRDFLTLLKSNQYPNITIAIPQKVLVQKQSTDSVILHDVLINIAGVSRKYDINYSIENANGKDSFLVGTTKIKLTDLNIEPPQKSFGLVKVKNEIIVKFGFCLKD